MKTHHSLQEADVEVLVIEDSERESSPLTELCSSPLIPPFAGALPPLGIPDADPHIPSTPPLHPYDVPPTPVSQEVGNPVSAPTLASLHQPEAEPASSRNQKQGPEVDPEEPRSEPGTPHTALEPLPALDLESIPVPTGSLATTKSRAGDAKPPVSTDKKPKPKSKKKAGPETQFTMDEVLRDKRLLAVGPDFEVDNDRITHQHIGPNSRGTMSRIFGGNPQRMISYPSSEKRRVHGFTSALLFPSRNFNPLLPTKIGERGLLFRLDQKLNQWVDNEGGAGPYHLMMHHTSDDYCYFGVYEFVRVDPVTKEEWLVQSSQALPKFLNHAPLILSCGQVKDNWVNHAIKTNTGDQTRARVFLRRDLGREPTKAEVKVAKKDKNLKSRVTVAQIMEDFDSGTEVLPSFILLVSGE